jgi:hypothetical protein
VWVVSNAYTTRLRRDIFRCLLVLLELARALQIEHVLYSCLLRRAVHMCNTHSTQKTTQTLTSRRQYFPVLTHSTGRVRVVRLTHHRSQSAREHARPHASQVVEQAQYPARNKMVFALHLVMPDSFECFQVCSISGFGAMTLTQSTAYHMLVTSRFVATPPASTMCLAKHSRTFRTFAATLGILTSLAPAVSYAKQSSANRTIVTTVGILTSFSPHHVFRKT